MPEVSGLVKHAVSSVGRSAAFSKFVAVLERIDGRRPNLLPVLTYHRVDEPDAHPALHPGLLSATPEAFDQQMSYLATNCYVVSMPELIDIRRTDGTLPPRSVLVTFDDAYRDFAKHAWPIMKRHGIPATLFVPTAFPDQPDRVFWWDRLYHALSDASRRDNLNTPVGRLSLVTADHRAIAFRRLRDYAKTLTHGEALALVDWICAELDAPTSEHSVLSWDDLRRLMTEGVTLGAHTRTHPLMNRISTDEMQSEVAGSLRDLESEIGSVPPIFAYPSGGMNERVVRALERQGCLLAFTTERGINDLRDADWLRLRRINVGRRTTLPVLRAQLLPWLSYLR